MKRSYLVSFVLAFAFGLSACQNAEPVCPQGSIVYHENASDLPPVSTQQGTPGNKNGEVVKINGKDIHFDTVIHGPLCNNTLSGTVYVACDLEIPKWQGKPDFFKDCDFSVDPGTVIYVAAHNNTPYYKGCASCHGSKASLNP